MKEFSRPEAEVVDLGDGVFTAGSGSYVDEEGGAYGGDGGGGD